MGCVISSDVGEAAWDEYVHRHPDGTVDHLWRWREVFSGVFGHECVYLAARDHTAVVGILPLVLFRSRIFGRSAVSVPFLNYGGVLADSETVALELIDRAQTLAREFGASHVELRHRSRTFPKLPSREHKLAMTRVLPRTPDELWNSIDRKVRNQVRKAQKEGLIAVTGGAAHVREFYSIFATNMRDLGTPVYSRRLFETTLRLFPDQARVVVVRRDQQALAAGIAIAFRETVLVPWASSLRAFRPLCPNMLLYWTMMEAAIAGGSTLFDFGRSSPGSGTHAFKLQWGAESTPLHWEYVLLSRRGVPDHGPSSPKFRLAVKLWERLPLRLANALGPLVVRSIP